MSWKFSSQITKTPYSHHFKKYRRIKNQCTYSHCF